MDREKLISYSFYYGGEYDRICKAIKNGEKVPVKTCSNALTIFDHEYPERLRQLERPPFVLFYKGDLELLDQPGIGIVGSREPCEYALRATEALVRKHQDMVIISGLAKGIDACSHKNALKTIGILGCGIDYYYPYCNRRLIDKVAAEGLIISEYPGLCRPLAFHFPFRNRLIAALSERVYIMQAKERSGTMTTVNEALELGREVRVLPYDIFHPDGSHNNTLINEGAMMIMSDEIAF